MSKTKESTPAHIQKIEEAFEALFRAVEDGDKDHDVAVIAWMLRKDQVFGSWKTAFEGGCSDVEATIAHLPTDEDPSDALRCLSMAVTAIEGNCTGFPDEAEGMGWHMADLYKPYMQTPEEVEGELEAIQKKAREPKEVILERVNNRDLRFTGKRIGHGTYGYEFHDRGSSCMAYGYVDASVYATESGKYVVHTIRTKDNGQDKDRKTETIIVKTPEEVLTALCNGAGHLHHASKEAWEDVTKHVDAFKPFAYEEV